MRLIIVLIIFFVSTNIHAENIKPFTTDGCSAFPDGTFKQKQLWLPCCTAHDYVYWQGGTSGERLIADEELRQCVSNLGATKTANLMYAGVRVGGNPYLPTSFRWGYGWPYSRFYQALTDAEKSQIKAMKSEP